MRALSAMLLLSLVGCDKLWGSYIGIGDFVLDGGVTSCAGSDTCDLAQSDAAPPDLYLPGCGKNQDCIDPKAPFCDLNSGQCVAQQPSSEAFPKDAAFQSTIALTSRYVLMATGDYNGDGITDIAVSGIFTNLPNASSASDSKVEIYIGDGLGAFKPDDTMCSFPGGNAPVYLLTVPAVGKKYSGILVAAYAGNVWYCERVAGPGGTWTPTRVGSAGGTGFRQLALANNEAQANPDLIIRTGKFRYLDAADTSGSLDVYRASKSYVFNGPNSQASSTNISWVAPIRPKGAKGDSLALTWDDPSPAGATLGRLGTEFFYTNPAFMTNSQGYSSTLTTSGTFFTLANKPLRTTTVLHTQAQDPSLLYTVSQNPNFVGVLYGTTVPTFTFQTTPTMWKQPGLMLPYAGDANGDGQDEIGLYSQMVPGGISDQHLQLLSYKNGVIDTLQPITDIATTTENFHGMALEYLGGLGDRRRTLLRKDLIVIMDNGTSSQLLIRRANLNYQFP